MKVLLALGAALGLVLLAATAASADSASQSTQLNLSVPSTISISALAASYTATTPAGATTTAYVGPFTVASNNPTGLILKVASSGNFFVGSGGNQMPVSDDIVGWSATASGCNTNGPLTSGSGTTIFASAAAGFDTIFGCHVVSVPGPQPPSTYSTTLTYVATTNP